MSFSLLFCSVYNSVYFRSYLDSILSFLVFLSHFVPTFVLTPMSSFKYLTSSLVVPSTHRRDGFQKLGNIQMIDDYLTVNMCKARNLPFRSTDFVTNVLSLMFPQEIAHIPSSINKTTEITTTSLQITLKIKPLIRWEKKILKI